MLYQIKCDGALVYSSASEEMAHIVLNPKLALDINDAGTLDFTLPPGNAMHGGLKKLKSVITMERDNKEIFRGRVLEDETDIYNQRLVYCEGQKSFLADSQIAPYTYTGTVRGLYTKLINNHNTKVDASKRFSVGVIDAVPDSETVTVENKNYASTESEIESKLLGAYGGYLRERTVGNTRYLDWVKEYGGTNSQEIRFAVNLLDLRNKVSAKDVFTVLYPLGAVQVNEDGEYTDVLTVASVNGGLDYIQNDAAVALFGRIERSHTWNHIESATELLAKGNEYLKTGIAVQTLTLKAIDMHILDGSISAINIGDKVRIVSDPHGIDLTMVCSRIVIDPVNPENTEYTFGENPRVLSDNVADTGDDVDGMKGRGGGKSLAEEMQDIIRWAEIKVDKANAQIMLSAGEIDNLKGRTSAAEIAINGAKAEIALKVSKDGVVSAINQTPETVKIQASKIDLSGYVTADQFSTEIANIGKQWSAKVSTAELEVSNSFTFQGYAIGRRSKSVQTSLPDFTTATVTLANGNQIKVVTGWADAPSNHRSTLIYLGDAF